MTESSSDPDSDPIADAAAAPGLGLDQPVQPAAAPVRSGGYRVLARAYRPQTFADLIGQDAMVQTLANAIERGRLAHAFLMTGVRGVGKTSTARLIAKALNCVGPDGTGGPTINPCGVCEPCRAIAEGRHIDVIEMDAASHTGVDDVREIIEAVRYAAVSARYKIYIIDEVHMLSRNAFNALLKTLEEPPEHVKFLFATTEVHKVPITVLSRCQRFDLRRIPVDLLEKQFADIVEKEGVSAQADALRLIAVAAEGSSRDGLSILDQAIAHAAPLENEPGGKAHVTADQVRKMLGLSDRGAARRLLDQILDGDAPALLETLAEQQALGVEPEAILNALLELIHAVTMAKASGDAARNGLLTGFAEAERQAIEAWAPQLSFPVLHRLWQLLLKGHEEVASAAHPVMACEMALLRLIHAASLPDPADLARLLRGAGLDGAPQALSSGAAGAGPEATAMADAVPPADVAMETDQAPSAPPGPDGASDSASDGTPPNFAALVAQLTMRHARIGTELHDCVSLVHYAPPHLEFRPLQPLDADFTRQVATAIKDVFDQGWTVTTSDANGEPSLRAQDEAAQAARRAEIEKTPIVAAALTAFPGAALVEPDRQTGSME